MTTSLTPELALAYVRELSTDFRAGIVLDAGEKWLAGDRELEGAARELLRTYARARELQAQAVFAARTDRHAMVVVVGPFALPGVVRRDVWTALSGLGGESAQGTRSERPEAALVKALVTASADAFRRHSAV